MAPLQSSVPGNGSTEHVGCTCCRCAPQAALRRVTPDGIDVILNWRQTHTKCALLKKYGRLTSTTEKDEESILPDLDDLFEDIFDGIKKRWRKQRKASKKRQEARKKAPQATPLERVRAIGAPRPPAQSTAAAEQADTRDSKLQAYLEQAQAYQTGLLELARNAPNEFNRSRLDNLTRHIDHWQNSLHALVRQVEIFQHNPLLQRDLKAVPKAIARLETELTEAPSPQVQSALERTLNNRRQQLAALESLRDMTRWAEVKIENTVSILGSLYSQALMSQSTGQVADYQRLLAEIEDEAQALDDYVTTLAEVKLGGASAGDVQPSTTESHSR